MKRDSKTEHKPNSASRYERLMQVSIRNSYYNKSENRCPDFAVHPTVATDALMRRLGLLFKDDGVGFSVLYDVSREENLLSYLRMQGAAGEPDVERKGVWTRLSFALSLRNMYFANFTQMPIRTNPTSSNFYFTNQNAHQTTDGQVILNRGKRVSAKELLPVTAVQHSTPVTHKVEFVRVTAISGVEVISEPRCVRRTPLPVPPVSKDSKKSDRADAPLEPLSEFVCTNVIFLDFSLLPEDKYTIEKVGYDGQPVGEPTEILYTASYPTPLCFIDLLFTDPNLESAGDSVRGIYPVRNLWSDAATVDPVDYDLKFRRRRTIWSYYIVPQPDSQRFEQLEIVDVTRRGREKPKRGIGFAGPCCVRLANGSTAYRFTSTETVPLQEQSRFRFQLRGFRRGAVPREGVLVDRLPVASNLQVLPESAEEMCLKLVESLCTQAEAEEACGRLIDQLCSEKPIASSRKQNNSEIYVYV